jgi:hypothetical protein
LFKKLKFDKESILAELNFKKRETSKNDSNVTTGQTASEADTGIDTKSAPRLLADNATIQHGFEDATDKKADDEGVKKVLRDKIAASDMMGSRFVEKENRKHIKLVIRFSWRNIENKTNESSTHTRSIRRVWATAPGSTNTSDLNPAANLNISAATKQQVEKKMTTQETPRVGKAPGSYLESPLSPKNSPDVRSPATDLLLTLKLR